jgi:hypothetical protein
MSNITLELVEEEIAEIRKEKPCLCNDCLECDMRNEEEGVVLYQYNSQIIYQYESQIQEI